MTRGISLSYGWATLNGRFLTAGRVQSADGQTYFDLDTNEIAGAIKFIQAGGGLKLVSDTDDLAKSKKRVFVVTPTTPYEIGDLWTDGTDIKKCTVTRLTGSYSPSDWGLASAYDRTQTVIDAGMITSGTLQVGNAAYINAGVTGSGASSSSVRFWAGQTYANRGIAPFRVLDDGSVVMTNATVTGTINATSGTIGGISISANDLFSLVGSKVQIYPAAGLASQGYADFTGTLKIPVTAPGSVVAGSIWAVDASGGGTAPVNYANLYSLQDVNIGGQTNGQALVWSSSSSKWIAGTVAAGSVDLSNYWTKSEADGRYLKQTGGYIYGALYGTSGTFSGYLDAQVFSIGAWDAFKWTSTALQIGGTSASQWQYLDFYTNGAHRFRIDNSGATFYYGVTATSFTGSLIGTASNATQWNGYQNNFVTGVNNLTVSSIIAFYSDGKAYQVTASSVQNYLGLGSNAYTSTAYLPLGGGNLSGLLTGTSGTFSGNLNADTKYRLAAWDIMSVYSTALQIGGITASQYTIVDVYTSGDHKARFGSSDFTLYYPLIVPTVTIATRLKIPTSAPGSPVAGDLWMVAV